MRLLIAPDKFKGSIDADAVAEAMARGARRADPTIDVDVCPLSDGGEGFVRTLTRATRGRLVTRRVTGPLPEMTVDATFGVAPDGTTAIVEMSSAAGLALLPIEDRNPLATTTFGVGELIRLAAEMGCRRVLLGIGGSATCDAGIGCLQACGCHVILSGGGYASITEPLCGRDLDDVQMVKSHRGGPPATNANPTSLVSRGADGVEILIACDVTNPLYGPTGSAVVYGPQKGADPGEVGQLDRMLRAFARRIDQDELAVRPGSGAAGGIGFGLAAILGARLVPGIDVTMDAVGFAERVARADLVLTGEGRLDAQTANGKLVAGVARACREASKRCVAIAGALGEGHDLLFASGLTSATSICDGPTTLDDAINDAAMLIERTTGRVVRMMR